MCQIITMFNTERPCTVPLSSQHVKTEGLGLNITIIFLYNFFYLRHSWLQCLVSYKNLFLTVTFGTDTF